MIEILNVQDKNGYELMNGNYDVLAKLPDNCTNGDMIRTMFPDMLMGIRDNTVYTDLDFGVWFSLDWWNTPYNV